MVYKMSSQELKKEISKLKVNDKVIFARDKDGLKQVWDGVLIHKDQFAFRIFSQQMADAEQGHGGVGITSRGLRHPRYGHWDGGTNDVREFKYIKGNTSPIRRIEVKHV